MPPRCCLIQAHSKSPEPRFSSLPSASHLLVTVPESKVFMGAGKGFSSSLRDQRVRQTRVHGHLALGSLPFVWPEATCNLSPRGREKRGQQQGHVGRGTFSSCRPLPTLLWHMALHPPCGLGQPGGPTGTWCVCCAPGDHGGSRGLSLHVCWPRVHLSCQGKQHGRVSTPGWAQTLGD